MTGAAFDTVIIKYVIVNAILLHNEVTEQQN
jgi:hypothetical protein